MRSRGLCVFVLLIVAAASGNGFAAASTPLPCGVYTGTIGAYAVVAEFCVAIPTRGGPALPGTVSGSYYYRKAGVSIDLNCSPQSDGTIRLDELVESHKSFSLVPSTDVWRVRARGDRIEGTWCHACAPGGDAASVDVRLVRIGALSSHPDDDDNDLYHQETLAYPLSRSGTHAAAGGITYVTVSDERYGVKTLELTSFPNERARLAANRVLALDLRNDRTNAFDCLGDARTSPSGSGYFAQTLTPSLVTVNLISLDERLTYFCGGPYPTTDDSRPITLDMRSGTVLAWTKALSPDAQHRLLRRYSHLVKHTGCDLGATALQEGGFQFWLTAAGLAVRPEFPHVIAVCNIVAVIPYAEARALFSPGYRALLP
jgi:hypothetical protein